MAETDEAGVDYYAVLNVRKEVKIVFQRERLRGIFYRSCKVHFIAFQVNEIELRAASRCMCIITRTSIKIPAKTKVRFKKLRPCSPQAKFCLFYKKFVDREPFQCERLFSSAKIFSTVTKVQRTELNLLPLVLDRELEDLFFTTNASLALLILMFLNIHRLFLTAVPDKVILSVLKLQNQYF